MDNNNIYGYNILAFLDIMGQKEVLSKMDGVLEKEHCADEIKPLVKSTVGVIRFFRKSFRDFLENCFQPTFTPLVYSEDRDIFDNMRSGTDFKFMNMSDAVVIWAPVCGLKDVGYPKTIRTLWAMLQSVVGIVPLLLASGYSIRGGIDLEGGVSIDENGTDIYGPVLRRAYHLESVEAQYPRILIGEGVDNYLNHISNMHFENPMTEKYSKALVQYCRECMTHDDDGKLIVHFLGPALSRMIDVIPQEANYYKQVLIPAGNFIARSVNKYENDKKLGSRYKSLQKYFDKYASFWE